MIWNNDTKRLEFEDGAPVGAVPLNQALEARGQRARKSHLQETQECKARRVEEAEQGAKRMVRKRDRKNLFQRHHDNLVKPRGMPVGDPRTRIGAFVAFDPGYFE